MANAVGLELAQRAPNGFWPDCLSCMHRQTQAVSGRVLIHRAKLFRAGATLVAAEPNPDHVSVLEANGLFDHALRVLYSKVPHRVEDPVQRDSEVTFAVLPSPLRALEQRREFLSPPLHHSGRDVHLGVQNILRMQLLHHAIGDEFVVLGGTQPLGDRLKCPQKPGEMLVAIEFARLFFSEDAPAVLDVAVTVVGGRQRPKMSPAQLSQRLGIDRALKMQVQLGLGQSENKGAGSVRTSCKTVREIWSHHLCGARSPLPGLNSLRWRL